MKVVDFQHVMSVVQTPVSAIRDSHILNTWYYVRNSVVWVKEKFQPGAGSFSRQLCCLFGIPSERSPQLKDFRWPLTLHFLTALTALINELNSELEGENKTAIKILAPPTSSEVDWS